MKARVLAAGVLFLLILVRSVFASWDKKPEFRWLQYFRYDTRHEHDKLYANRISAGFTYFDSKENPLFKVTPFYEARRNYTTNYWERQELGAEIGKDVFSWVYTGLAMQQVLLHEAYRQYAEHQLRGSTEMLGRLKFSHSLLDKKFLTLKGFVLDEYTYDIRSGAATRNEVAMGVVMPVNKYLEAGLDWRHIDRIHDFDSDAIEVLLTVIF